MKTITSILQGKITTCDLGDPHYHIAAKEIEIYQDDRLVLRHLFYKEGNLPFCTFLTIPSPKGKNQLPQVS